LNDERRSTGDVTSAFAAFGFFYLGGVQYTLYVPVFLDSSHMLQNSLPSLSERNSGMSKA
jgi:hypothetical protein